ncbi:MAG TPA: hypothetical protein VHA15_08495 [Burkholderiales bacterium]|jgi:hypothetical protein|nr:hypothetical protein [Burkholderiales bacterium]
MAAAKLKRAAIALLVGLLAGSSPGWAAESNPPYPAEENADGSRFVWLVLKRSGMEFDYLPADHFAESPRFRPIEHGMQDTGDVAWWPHFMAIYDPNFPRARELPPDVAIITAQGPRSLAKLEEELGPATFYRYRK